jgi:hypothetical protein
VNKETVLVKLLYLKLRVHGENKTQKIAENALFSIFLVLAN